MNAGCLAISVAVTVLAGAKSAFSASTSALKSANVRALSPFVSKFAMRVCHVSSESSREASFIGTAGGAQGYPVPPAAAATLQPDREAFTATPDAFCGKRTRHLRKRLRKRILTQSHLDRGVRTRGWATGRGNKPTWGVKLGDSSPMTGRPDNPMRSPHGPDRAPHPYET